MEHIVDNSHLRVNGEWLKVWKAKVPQKFKLLLWRSLRNVLPTRENLQRKGVECTPLCPHCELYPENTWHAFFGCDKALECWTAAGLWIDVSNITHNADGFTSATFQLLSTLSQPKVYEMINTFWCIWRRRNDQAWRGEEVPAKEAVLRSREFMQDWCRLRNREGGRDTHLSGASNLIWVKPRPGEFKCNLDAALFPHENLFGIGMCIRNESGRFIKAKTLCFPGSIPPHEAEAIGLLEDLIWVNSLGFNKMSFETDCKSVADDILEGHNYITKHGTILNQCIALLNSNKNYEVSFIRRQANFVAHSLARASRLYASHHAFNSIPSCIRDLIMNEMA